MTKKRCLMALAAVLLLSGCIQTVPISNSNAPIQKSDGEVNSNVSDSAPVVKTTGRTLDLSGQGLATLSTKIFNDTSIEILDVSSNKLTGALPSEIGKLKNLRILRASNNLMTGVPAEVGHLLKLEIIDLSNNQITGLPLELGNLKNLQTLNLTGNSPSQFDLDKIRASIPQANIIY